MWLNMCKWSATHGEDASANTKLEQIQTKTVRFDTGWIVYFADGHPTYAGIH